MVRTLNHKNKEFVINDMFRNIMFELITGVILASLLKNGVKTLPRAPPW